MTKRLFQIWYWKYVNTQCPKLSIFNIFFLHEIITNWKKSSPSFESPCWYKNWENIIFQLSITNFSEWFKIVEKNFLIDAHVKTPSRIIWMPEFCLRLWNLRQGAVVTRVCNLTMEAFEDFLLHRAVRDQGFPNGDVDYSLVKFFPKNPICGMREIFKELIFVFK